MHTKECGWSDSEAWLSPVFSRERNQRCNHNTRETVHCHVQSGQSGMVHAREHTTYAHSRFPFAQHRRIAPTCRWGQKVFGMQMQMQRQVRFGHKGGHVGSDVSCSDGEVGEWGHPTPSVGGSDYLRVGCTHEDSGLHKYVISVYKLNAVQCFKRRLQVSCHCTAWHNGALP